MTASTEPRPGRAADAWRRYGVDVPVAVLVTAAQVGFTYADARHHGLTISTGGHALLLAGGLSLIWRRRFVVTVLAVALGTTLWYTATPNPDGAIWCALVVAFGTAIYYRQRAAAIASLVVGYVGSVWLPVLTGPHKGPTLSFAVDLALGLLILLAAAEGLRFRHERVEAQRHVKQEEARRLASEERVRIARDLHDVVAHNISVINVQAATALHLADRQPERAIEALSTIHGVSRQALVELRSILGVLRDVDDELPRDPAPSLANLDDLVATARSAGLRVRVAGDELGGSVPRAVDVAAYRIVQEALTNAARHAAGSTAVVRIASDDGHLVVEVEDSGGAKVQSLAASGSGHGIAGMTERAEALGGTLAAGARPEGGFSVRARLPLDGRGHRSPLAEVPAGSRHGRGAPADSDRALGSRRAAAATATAAQHEGEADGD